MKTKEAQKEKKAKKKYSDGGKEIEEVREA